MDFVSVILFLVMYYLRPQEWGALFAKIHFVQLVTMLAVACLILRERGFRAKDLLKTPHDWMMLAFFTWTTLASGAPWATFWEVLPFATFYIVIVHTLTDVHRIKLFAGWWTFLIVAVAALALASEYGFDPLGSYDISHGRMKDRLILNLSIFKNPNALGHNVVPAFAMLYFFCIWKRPLFMKEIGLALSFIPAYCIWLTVSKGSFLCAGITILASQVFGRPKYVQVILLCGALLFGGTILWSLPRMTELNTTRTDEAIMGRVAAFTHGLRMIETQKFGIGYGNWMTSFREAHGYRKAAHSSYVQIGSELGKVGFFLFLGILYCCLRTLMMAHTSTDDEERIRRMMFVLVISYMASSWMVDFGYRPTFFMFAGAIAAFHRQLYGVNRAMEEEAAAEKAMAAVPAWRARLLPQPSMVAALPNQLAPAAVYTLERAAGPSGSPMQLPKAPDEPLEEGSPAVKPWMRIGFLDLALIGVLFIVTMRFWGYAVHHL
ncbi:MAG: O-antigen ligase family protein [Verrucomicrobiaceae bacterium]|nr:MAG: O-antigen ligase family protein [Verrucomicrobiaceae bacterium]